MKKQQRMRAGVLVLAAVLLVAGVAQVAASVKTWTGDGDWFTDTANWDGGLPGAGDDVVVASGNLLLASSTPALASFTLNGGTVTMTNWTTQLEATDVTINGGKLTHGGNMGVTISEGAWIPVARVYIVCSNLTVGSSGSIEANDLGYKGARFGDGGERTGYGPGGSFGATGGSYGGVGAMDGWGTSGAIYGDAATPDQPGSGAGAQNNNDNDRGGNGGGYIRIDATGHVIVDGTISVNGGPGANRPAGGSGGAVLLYCRTLAGSGIVYAEGGRGSSSTYGNAGGGGRIAVHYDAGAQAALTVPSITFTTFSYSAAGAGSDGDMGTLWFTDNRFLASTALRMTGQWVGAEPVDIGLESLTIPAERRIRFGLENARVTITNNLEISGSRAQLAMGGNTNVWRFAPRIYAATTTGPTLTVGGDVSLQSGGSLHINAAQSHSAGTGWGATVDIEGNLGVESGAALVLRSQPVHGSAPRVRAGTLTVDAGGLISAAGAGYRGGIQSALFPGGGSAGLGPGAGSGGNPGGGGGYGGQGGGTSSAYGQIDVPQAPGSGGGTMLQEANDRGGFGGGLVWLDVAGTATINGTISATAGGASGRSSGGGGGGLMLHADTLNAGDATLAASGTGATDSRVCGGGGGRIALHYRTGTLPATVALDNPAGSGTRPGHKGTWFSAQSSAAGSPLRVDDGTPALSTQSDPLSVESGVRLVRSIAEWTPRRQRWTDTSSTLDNGVLVATATYTLKGLPANAGLSVLVDDTLLESLTAADENGELVIAGVALDAPVTVQVELDPKGTVIFIQ